MGCGNSINNNSVGTPDHKSGDSDDDEINPSYNLNDADLLRLIKNDIEPKEINKGKIELPFLKYIVKHDGNPFIHIDKICLILTGRNSGVDEQKRHGEHLGKIKLVPWLDISFTCFDKV